MTSRANTSHDVDAWAALAAPLRPIEQLALIGLHIGASELAPEDIVVSAIVGEAKCARASSWLSSHFRALLHGYCDFCSTMPGPFLGDADRTAKTISALASVLTATLNISIVPAVGFSAYALTTGVSHWCKRYGKLHFDGEAIYKMTFYQNAGATQELPGSFSAVIHPEIKEYIRDSAYTKDPRHRIDLYVPASAQGRFIPAVASQLDTIIEHRQGQVQHCLAGKDLRSEQSLNGSIDSATLTHDGPAIVFSIPSAELKKRNSSGDI